MWCGVVSRGRAAMPHTKRGAPIGETRDGPRPAMPRPWWARCLGAQACWFIVVFLFACGGEVYGWVGPRVRYVGDSRLCLWLVRLDALAHHM